MNGMTFASFRVDANNQAAFDLCRRFAVLDDLPEGPFTLLGDKATGKSHLLWAVVNHFRENQTPVSVALISAGDFPQKVRNIATNPAPIQKGRPAILLVDELEQFRDTATDLEGVVRAFLENGKTVAIASRVHPSVIPFFSGRFKSILVGGRIVGLTAPVNAASTGDLAAAATSAELDAARAALKASEGELLDLRGRHAAKVNELDAARADAENTAAELRRLHMEEMARMEAQRRRIEGLDAALSGLMGELDILLGDAGDGDDPANGAYDRLAAEKWKAEAALEEALREKGRLQAELANALSRDGSADEGGQVKPLKVPSTLKSVLGRAFADPDPPGGGA